MIEGLPAEDAKLTISTLQLFLWPAVHTPSRASSPALSICVTLERSSTMRLTTGTPLPREMGMVLSRTSRSNIYADSAVILPLQRMVISSGFSSRSNLSVVKQYAGAAIFLPSKICITPIEIATAVPIVEQVRLLESVLKIKDLCYFDPRSQSAG